MIGLGLDVWRGVKGLGGNGAPFVPPNAPAQEWRLSPTAVTDSQADSTLVSAMMGAAAAKSFPSYTVATGASRTLTFDVPVIAAPGGLLYFIFDVVVTPTAQRSFDGGTTWSDLTYNVLSYQGGDITTAIKRGQMIEIPAGAASQIRFVIANASGSLATVYLKLHQLPATGKADAWVVHGASLESTMPNLQMLQSWRSQFPTFDPIFFNWAQSSQSGSRIKTLVDDAITRLPWVFYFLYDIGGNDVTSGRPYVDGTTTLPSFGQALDAINAANRLALPFRITYRNYTSAPAVDGATNLNNGSLPYNLNIIDPTILSKAPWAYDTSLQIGRGDWYSLVEYNRELLLDEVHHTDAMRLLTIPFWGDVFGRWVYTGAYPASWAEQMVAALEASKTEATYARGLEVLGTLPSTAAKTALQVRMAALSTLPTNTAAPVLSGAFVVGAVVSGTTGTWTGFPAPTYSYQWYADGTAISGATSNTFTITSSELGKVLRMDVTGTNSKGSATASSANSAAVTAGGSYDPMTDTLLARMTVQPNTTQANKIDTLMRVLKTLNRTAFFMFAAHDKQAALLDWVRTSTTAELTATEPAFTALSGFQGSGSSVGVDVKAVVNATSGYSKDSGSYGFGISVLGSGTIIGTIESSAQIYATTPQSVRSNNAASVTAAAAYTAGSYVVTRIASTGFTLRKEQAARESLTQTSATLAANNIAMLRTGAATGTHRVSHFHIGPALTDQQELDLHAAIATYLA